jgi:hypothetical protein
MGRSLLIFLLQLPVLCVAQSKSLSVDDLLTLTTLAPKNYDSYMSKKGFLPGARSQQDKAMAVTFFEKQSPVVNDVQSISRTVDLYKKDDTWCFVLKTSSKEEYQEGRNILKKAGFFYDNAGDTSQPTALMFQKRDITVLANSSGKDENPVYTFLLQKKEFPDPGAIRFGDDLLKFDSHEHLVSFFGADNVKEDVYHFSEKETRKCSVLYGNTSQQVVFIWDDEKNLYKISFILISGVLPTASAVQYTGSIAQNAWVLKNGLYVGMRLKDLLKLNGNDFEFYGRNSEFAFMIEPEKTRNIDFKKVGIMLDCFNCSDASLLNKEKVSAEEAADQGLAVYISCVMISP